MQPLQPSPSLSKLQGVGNVQPGFLAGESGTQIHSGERAYQCHICSKTFTQSGSLQTHIKYVHMKMQPPPRKRNKKTAA
ncbi:hypothetical protein MSG28_016115 [Choristoneura fumiferana]|uniref:Uncharacterized protein n=1 Tax=Choristoneura fumiferana TaxID=7141 RepID=A0ACC0K5B0_CHOFU|nr:hypothetical protein MSG28_016115 [Choristoneura fumiferana]